MKNNFIGAILLILVLTGCAHNAHNLAIPDRIPHEVQKGYIQFQSVVNLENGKEESKQTTVQNLPNAINQVKHSITKIEYGNEIPIYEMPITLTMKPITDRAGNQVYNVGFPENISIENQGVNSFQQTQYLNAFSNNINSGMPTIVMPPQPTTTARWKSQKKQIEIPVNVDMLTLVKLNLILTPDKGNNGFYKGALKFTVDEPKPYQHKSSK